MQIVARSRGVLVGMVVVVLGAGACALAGCSAPRKALIPVDSSLRTWEAPEMAESEAEPAAPAQPAAAAPAAQ